MRAIVLGSAAGGGVPQWNCRCAICEMARSGDSRVASRTQSSLAVSADGINWLVLNASPDIRQQLGATPALHPARRSGSPALRHSPIRAVMLTNGDVDHVAGLLTLREQQPFRLLASADTLGALADNRVFDVLAAGIVSREPVTLDEPHEVLPGLTVTLFAVPGKVPLWLEDGTPDIGGETGSTVGALIASAGRTIAYVPGCAAVTDGLRARLEGVDVLLFDGTVLEDDDMIRAGTGTKTGWRMGHVPMSISMPELAPVRIGRRIFIHINNTNPALVEGSPENRRVREAGWELAHDGLEIAP